jgi:hypothetical protein
MNLKYYSYYLYNYINLVNIKKNLEKYEQKLIKNNRETALLNNKIIKKWSKTINYMYNCLSKYVKHVFYCQDTALTKAIKFSFSEDR